jgi:hypothetical protein
MQTFAGNSFRSGPRQLSQQKKPLQNRSFSEAHTGFEPVPPP